MADDNIQHGIDDNAQNDAEKGAALGGLGGAAVGAIAGAAAGPVGAVVGSRAVAWSEQAPVASPSTAVDKVDNDNTITGLADDGAATYKNDDAISDMDTTGNLTGNRTSYDVTSTADTNAARLDSNTVTGIPGTGAIGGTTSDHQTRDYRSGEATGDYDTATDLRTGTTPTTARSGSDHDLTGATSNYERDYGTGSAGELAHDQRNATSGLTSIGGTDMNADADLDNIGNGIPGVQTGGTATDGAPDTRGITEKAADTITGDKFDDNTGKRVDY